LARRVAVADFGFGSVSACIASMSPRLPRGRGRGRSAAAIVRAKGLVRAVWVSPLVERVPILGLTVLGRGIARSPKGVNREPAPAFLRVLGAKYRLAFHYVIFGRRKDC
jgi:hypothetical protein